MRSISRSGMGPGSACARPKCEGYPWYAAASGDNRGLVPTSVGLQGNGAYPRHAQVFKAPWVKFFTTDVVSTADPSTIVESPLVGAPWAVRHMA